MENSELIQYSLRQIVDEKVPFAVFNTERELIHANPILQKLWGTLLKKSCTTNMRISVFQLIPNIPNMKFLEYTP